MEGKVFAVRLLKSPIGLQRKDRDTIRGMGFRRVGETKLLHDTPAIRGMIFKMSHMLEVRPLKSEKEYEKIEKAVRLELPPIIEMVGSGSEPKPKEERVRKPLEKEAKKPHQEEKKAKASRPKKEEKKAEKKIALKKHEPKEAKKAKPKK